MAESGVPALPELQQLGAMPTIPLFPLASPGLSPAGPTRQSSPAAASRDRDTHTQPHAGCRWVEAAKFSPSREASPAGVPYFLPATSPDGCS